MTTRLVARATTSGARLSVAEIPHDAYLAGLRRELVGKKGDDRDAILAEIKRVGGVVPDASPPPVVKTPYRPSK